MNWWQTGLSIVGLSFLSAYLYYLGGEGKKQVRRFGCPAIALITLWLSGITAAWYAWIVAYGTMYGAMTTYWKGDAEDAKWYHWLITGLAYGLSALPFVIWGSVLWVWFIIRTIVLGLLIMIWSEQNDDVLLEAGGRGFWFCLSLALLKL